MAAASYLASNAIQANDVTSATAWQTIAPHKFRVRSYPIPRAIPPIVALAAWRQVILKRLVCDVAHVCGAEAERRDQRARTFVRPTR
jgi:hypothetical protein